MNERRSRKALCKEAFLQTLNKNIITSDELDQAYNEYLLNFHGYKTSEYKTNI